MGSVLNTSMNSTWASIDAAFNRSPHTYTRRLLLIKLTPFLLEEDARESKIQQKHDKELGTDLIPASLESQKVQREVLRIIGKTEAEKHRYYSRENDEIMYNSDHWKLLAQNFDLMWPFMLNIPAICND